jgi:exopolyphosphatase / guanosine-5'-triphosphate,3'-diphosphate pyrophosphatase
VTTDSDDLRNAARGPAVFPLRAAAIDVGSNAMRLLVGEFTGPESWVSLVQQRVPVRLGASVFDPHGGTIDDNVLDAAIAGLVSFRQRMDELEVIVYRASATSATREASNGDVLLDRALHEAGIRLEEIGVGEEARLVWLGASSRLQPDVGRWAFVDLGGGSVEVGVAEGQDVLWSESHAMGSVRLLAELGDTARTPQKFRRLATEYIDTLTSRMSFEPGEVKGLVATGGNIEELARLADAPADERGVARLTLKALDRTLDRIAGLTTQQRIDEMQLRPDRADVIVPAALVYDRIARLAGVEEITVPFAGLKDGLLLDAVMGVAQHQAHFDRQQRELLAGCMALGRRYLFDEAHAQQVARLSLRLFDQLEDELDFAEADRLLLLAAALLHDIGQYIAYRRHHKHSYYLISNASLPDLTPHDTQLVALIARYHRRAEPSAEHEGFVDLDDEDQERVTRLASLLRVADAMDRQHRQHVRTVDAQVHDGDLRLAVTADGDVDLEEWAISKKSQLLARVLDADISVTIAGAAGDVTPR